MGQIHKDPLNNLVITLSSTFNINQFVETGTYIGEASLWASSIFDSVITIEKSKKYYEIAYNNLKDRSNINLIFGDSGDELKNITPEITNPALFWLDAHTGGGYFGDEDHCPLLDEIRALNLSPTTHYILIDDARAFLAPPPPPFSPDAWPSIDTLIMELESINNYLVIIINDVIMAVPRHARNCLIEYCNKVRPKI